MDNRILAVIVVALLASGVVAGYEVRGVGVTTTVSTQSIFSTTTALSTTTVTRPTTWSTTYTTTLRVTQSASGEVPSITTVEESNTSIMGFPNAVAIDYATNMIYLTDEFSNILTIVNGTTDRVTEAVSLSATPTGIVVDSNINTIFVSTGDCIDDVNASDYCGSAQLVPTQPAIVAINGSTDRVYWSVPVNAMVVAVDEDRDVLYATQGHMIGPVGNSTGSLLAMRANTGSLIANTSLGAYPWGVALDSRTHTLYVSACQVLSLVCGGAEVLVINGTSNTMSTTIPVQSWAPPAMVLDTLNNVGYLLADSNVTKIVAIDLASDKEIHSSVLGSTCADISLLGIDLFEGQLYAVASSAHYASGLLLVINSDTGNIVDMFSVPGQIVGFAPGYNGFLYSTIESSSSQTSASLVSLSETFPIGFVNTGLIASGVCQP